MDKVVIISSTNRPNSNSLKVSKIYQSILSDLKIEHALFDFQNLPHNLAFSESFGKRTNDYNDMLNKHIRPFQKFIIISPEYNGSFPGILKTFLDSLHPKDWANKKVCLVGVADGRAGNLRGMEHLTGILQYLKMHVYHNKLPISLIGKILTPDSKFNSEEQLNTCRLQVEGFLNF
jgi:NAD(P)H-dependent FMN reductase